MYIRMYSLSVNYSLKFQRMGTDDLLVLDGRNQDVCHDREFLHTAGRSSECARVSAARCVPIPARWAFPPLKESILALDFSVAFCVCFS